MNLKSTPLVLFLFCQTIMLLGQNIEYLYDGNGNRISRKLVVEQLESSFLQFPVMNVKSLKKTQDVKSLDLKLEEGEISSSVYPNPSKGIIKVDISNMPSNATTELRLYNLSGTEILFKRNFESYDEIDISYFKDGIYILRIKIDDRLFDWKIIKSH